jgi:hypothetical protein
MKLQSTLILSLLLLSITSGLAAQDRPDVSITYHDNQVLADQVAQQLTRDLYRINQNDAAGTLLYDDSDLIVEAYNRGFRYAMSRFSSYLHDLHDRTLLVKGLYLGTENPEYGPVQELLIQYDANGNMLDYEFLPAAETIVMYLLSDKEASVETNDLARGFLDELTGAYKSKDVELLSRLFSEQSFVNTAVTIEDEWVYHRVNSGKEYLNSLQRIFSNSADIEVTYSDVEVFQHPESAGSIMIQARQSWISSNYRDEGYVIFILEDVQNNYPGIIRRSWDESPAKAADFSAYRDFRVVEKIADDKQKPVFEEPVEPRTGTLVLHTGHEELLLHLSGEDFSEQIVLHDETRQIELKPGSYELHAEIKGYKHFQAITEISAGKVFEMEIELDKEPTRFSRRNLYIAGGAVLAASVAIIMLTRGDDDSNLLPFPPGRPN